MEITVDGESKAFLPLGEDDSIRIDTDGGYNVITVKDGEVTVSEADCRDQICVEHKKIRKTGETIVCLPHKLVVTVTGDKPGDFDAVGDVKNMNYRKFLITGCLPHWRY